MNILILGGSGYLGSRLIKKLAADNEGEIVFTRRSTSDLSGISDLLGKKRIRAIQANCDAIETVMQYCQIDMVMNMVCNYGRGARGDNDTIKANLIFPLDVLNCVVEHGVKRFLTIGTGLPDELNMYSFSKKTLGEYGRFYAEHKGLDFYNLLLEMFYGADEPKNRFITGTIEKMLRGEEVRVTIGTQRRDIIAIDDVLNAIVSIANSDLHGYQEISVGTGVAPTVSEIIDYIWELTGRKSTVLKGAIPMRDNEPDCVANTKALCRLGEWKPMYWKEGIRAMVSRMKGEVV